MFGASRSATLHVADWNRHSMFVFFVLMCPSVSIFGVSILRELIESRNINEHLLIRTISINNDIMKEKRMNIKQKILLSVLLGLFLCLSGHSQNVALKTNTLGWATVSPNLGLEVGLGPQSTLDLYGSINPFSFNDGKQWKHWFVMPEYRYWFCEKFYGHFVGIHLVGGEYNIGKVKLPFGIYSGKTRNARYEGWGVGGGIAYGYQWLLSKHFSIEGTLGAGYVRAEYRKYPCAECGTKLASGHKNYFGLTKAAISLIYVF